MSTQAQIDANRRNSLLSTGPRTDSGKAASARNSTRTGLYSRALLLANEDAAAFRALAGDYLDSCNPQGPVEAALVQELLRCDWLLRRLDTIETDLWERQIETRRRSLGKDFDEEILYAFTYPGIADELVVVQRRVSALSRTYHRALHDLQRLQSARAAAAPPAPASDPQPEIGFVPPTPADPASDPPAARPIGFLPQPLSGNPARVRYNMTSGHVRQGLPTVWKTFTPVAPFARC
jgi:hypothetical protein